MIISNFCKKGGVGKTTLTGYMGHYLATKGFTVLFVSIDDQNSIFSMFGKKDAIDNDEYEFFDTVLTAEGIDSKKRDEILSNNCIIEIRNNLYGIKTQNTYSFSTQAVVDRNIEKRFGRVMKGLTESFDVILFDYPPSSNRLTELLIEVSDITNIIVGMEQLSLDGFENTLQYFTDLEIPFDAISYVIPNMYVSNRTVSKECLPELIEQAKAYLPNVEVVKPIPDVATIKNIQKLGYSIFDENIPLKSYDKTKLLQIKEGIVNLCDKMFFQE